MLIRKNLEERFLRIFLCLDTFYVNLKSSNTMQCCKGSFKSLFLKRIFFLLLIKPFQYNGVLYSIIITRFTICRKTDH